MARRHLALVYRGTGGVIGEDLVSRVCQGAADLVEEINPDYPASMGGLAVGTAVDLNGLSMDRGCAIGFENGKKEFLKRYAANPQTKVVIGGYSQGAVVAAMLRQWLQINYPENYLCSFSFGDPTRPVGGCYFAGTPTQGCGIASWHYGDVTDWRHCWLAHPGDMYTSVPDNAVGKVLQDGYDGVTKVQISDPLVTAEAIVKMVLAIAEDSGASLPMIARMLLRDGPACLPEWLVPFVINALEGLIGGLMNHNTASQSSAAAGVEAALIGLRFVGDNPPTRCHISYHIDEVWPGQTYLGLAIQHVRDWASRVRP